uniref:RING-type E3 ubiquitin transferase n=1 Tax=Romanomermis culicivorax TaxID=13658 RepID=A0A915JCH0_ROMCU
MTDNTQRSSAAAMSNNYFCHLCSRNFTYLDADYTCPVCHSGFVEIVENAAQPNAISSTSDIGHQQPSRSNSNDLDLEAFIQLATPFITNMFRPPSSSTGSSSSSQQQPSMHPSASQSAAGQVGGMQQQVQAGPFPSAGLQNGNLHGSAADYAWGPGGLDAIVTQLLNQVQGGAPPMSRENLDNLHDIPLTKEQIDKRLQCAVCMDDFKMNEKAVQLICEHLYHKSCIVPWLERVGLCQIHSTCPVCRKSAETGEPLQTPTTQPQQPPFQNFFGPVATQPSSSRQQSNRSSSTTSGQQGSTTDTTSSSNERPQWMDIDDLD